MICFVYYLKNDLELDLNTIIEVCTLIIFNFHLLSYWSAILSDIQFQ